ncbi:MAG: D-amino acid dehydrogenase [Gammaproteobacteria bacterium]
MKVVVLGSGIIGVSTAYYLARAGQEVVVVDRQSGPALETSFANAGQVSPGYSAPWAAPGIPLKAIKWMLQEHSPLVIRPRLDAAMLSWLARMLRNCTAARYAVNKERMLRLATYSRESLELLRQETGISYDQRTQGTLQLFRTQKQVDSAAKDIAILEQCGVPYELLDPVGCIRAEPALTQVRDKIAGGLRLPGDETGDCFKFTQALAAKAEALGVEFRYDTAIEGLLSDGNSIDGVRTSAGIVRGDAYVMALGSYSPLLLRPLGIRIPVYPVKGYSITVPVVDPAAAPVSTVMDETHKVALTRLGDRIRVAGMAEISGYDLSLRPKQRKTLEFVVRDLYPRGGDVSQAEFWTGLRPMTPDGTPVVGPSTYRNLYLNTGHGTLGWTMGPGSGRLLANLISGQDASIPLSGLTMDRYLDKVA